MRLRGVGLVLDGLLGARPGEGADLELGVAVLGGGSSLVTVPSQPRKKPSGMDTMPGSPAGTTRCRCSPGSSDRFLPVGSRPLPGHR